MDEITGYEIFPIMSSSESRIEAEFESSGWEVFPDFHTLSADIQLVIANGTRGERGEKGDKGDTGATGATGATGTGITGITQNNDGTLTIALSDGTSYTTAPAKGETGKGITSIAKTGTSGLVDTYTITFSDGTTTTFTVTNGRDGTGTGDMEKVVYDLDDDGIVDAASGDEDGLNIKTYYAKKTDLPSNVSDLTNDAGYVASSTTERLTVADTAPSSPSEGDVWIDTSSL